MKGDYRYIISVIMPLYNVEVYVEEAINSIINQTIGFKKNIQLILVNDGSSDNTGSLCQKYKQKYPENIIYVEQENKGVSSARNAGIEFVEGKYVNFFDGDDIWDIKAFSNMYDFFEVNYDDVDFVAARYCFFGKNTGFEHPLDYKFDTTRVVDINIDYKYIQLSAATTLIKADAIKKRKFDTKMNFSEDAVFMTQILLEKEKYGVVRDAVYNYRKRDDGSSAVDSTINSYEWYVDIPGLYFENLFEKSMQKYGRIIPYIQFLAMYDLQWRIKHLIPKDLNDEVRAEYKSKIVAILKKIDDSVIAQQKKINFAHKIFALSLKHETDITKLLKLHKNKIYYNDVYLFNIRGKNRLCITNMQIRNDSISIEGYTHLHILGEKISLGIQTSGGEDIPMIFFPVHQKDIYGFSGERIFEGRGFRVNIPLMNVKWIHFYMEYNNERQIILSPTFGRFAKLNKKLKNDYYAHGNYIIKYGKNKIKIIEKNAIRLMLAEFRYLRDNVLPDKHYFKIGLMRICSYVYKFFIKKPIWIISDRTDMARDNGEALFTYLCEHNKDKCRKIYFVLDKKSVDFRRMKKTGKVLKLDSLKYKLSFLQADKIISAHADDWVINAFGKDRDIVKNLYDFDYIFLQHGITKDDLSIWLHKFNKNINIFVTAVRNEYKSIVEGDYGYTEEEVILTGFPRYDKLINKPQRKIVILPTWRKNIATNTIKGTSVREYSSTFKDTDYFKFYNSLINDERLLSVMDEYGFRGEFYIHPAFFAQINDFTGNDILSIANEEADYQKIFRENMLMVTDFSSVAFDFAYMKKPVIYSQFDYDSFFDGHSYEKGYFDYNRDGFGPVCYDYETTVNAIINCIKNECNMEKIYEDRVDNFFMYTDQNNCERVYNEIVKLDKNSK